MERAFNNFAECTHYIKKYPNSFKKANVNADTLWNLDRGATITETYTEYVNGKLTEKHEKEINAKYYANVISGIGFFKDRTYKEYTPFGYIATHLTARAPYGDIKVTRTYKITANR